MESLSLLASTIAESNANHFVVFALNRNHSLSASVSDLVFAKLPVHCRLVRVLLAKVWKVIANEFLTGEQSTLSFVV
jgi:hypothetical protein